MRAFPFTFYRDRFGSSYQILSHIGEAVHPAAELMRFSCPVSAQSFLRNLRVPIDFWRNFLTHSKHTGYAARSYNDREYQIRVIALQLIHRHIRVYQFPDLIKKAIRNHHGALYTFVKGPIPYPVEGLRPLTLQNEQQADQLLSSLNITKAEQWHYLLNDHGLLPEGANPHKTPVGEYQAIVAQSLIAGGLLAYQTRDAPTPPTPGEIDLPLQARDKPASLAPDTPKYFTELEYLYDDRSGIPEGVPYVATFSDGSQKQGMLDESGYVYIKDIPAGQVEVEFGDPQAKQQLDAARTELKSYLDSIVSEVQSRGKRLDAELNKLNVLEQGMVLTGAFMVGLYDSAADIVVTAKMIAETGIELISDIDELKLKTFNIVISGDIETAKQELEDLVAYGEETLGTMQETYTTLQLLYTDGEIKTLLTDFPEQYFKAMPAVEQAGAASGLALSLLFALVTGGAGAAAGAASKAPMFIKAAKKLQEIIALIKKVKLHKKQSRPHNNKIAEKTDKPKEDKLKEKEKKASSKPAPLAQHKVPCFHPYDKAKFKGMSPDAKREYLDEYNKQLRRQQETINSMSVNDFKAAREAYAAEGRNPLADGMQGGMRKKFKKDINENIGHSILKNNPETSRLEARELAKKQTSEIMKKLVALHEPDMVSGGYNQPNPKHMGRKDINESIGGSWNQGGRLAGIDDEVNKAVANKQGNGKMNLKLEVCRGNNLR
ncbi:hypothetical protein MNBD_GAMMA09-715 [hydrothermal vent metagenome]|uniref:Novel toxin 15 domain-containing protein n=1 Tax=hydrothermal vent metagenome TaxID=652676 RepID=A0A3B0WZ60_9ZZZZ